MANNKPLKVLKNRNDFLFLLKVGHRCYPSDWLLVNYVRNDKGTLRCGWTLPRNVGSAVIRNRLKRWSRVYVRNQLLLGRDLPLDVNLVFRRAGNDFYKKLDYDRFSETLDKAWRQLEQRAKNAASIAPRGLSNDRNNSPRGKLSI